MTSCFHCGLPAPDSSPWSAKVLGQWRTLCCGGCQAVTEAIVASGGEKYYEQRTDFGLTPEAVAGVAGLESILDDLAWQHDHAAGQATGNCQDVTLRVEGLRCGACGWLIEKTLSQQAGVQRVRVNAATERIFLQWDSERTRLSLLANDLQRIGYGIAPILDRDPVQALREKRQQHRRLFVAGLGAAQIMMYAYPEYIEGAELAPEVVLLMRWSSLLITLPVVLYSARPFFDGAWRSLRHGSVGMDVAVSLGVVVAFLASVWATVTQTGTVWYDSVSMFVFLLLTARLIDQNLRRQALTIRERLHSALPASALRWATQLDHGVPGTPGSHLTPLSDDQRLFLQTFGAGVGNTVRPEALTYGDLVAVRAGETFPADLQLLDHSTQVDLSLLTGESLPVPKQIGDLIPGGAVNAGQTVLGWVERAGSQATLAQIIRLTERSLAERPRFALLADRVAAYFTAGLIAIAALTAVAWASTGHDWLAPMLAVLVVSCPCALSLATPTAYAAASARALKEGVVLHNPELFAALERVSDVVFDKTGTLTWGNPSVIRVESLGPDGATVALALATLSAHPVSKAIVRRLTPLHGAAAVSDVEQHDGRGLTGRCHEASWRLGNLAYCSENLTPADASLQFLQRCYEQGASTFLQGPTGAAMAFWIDDPLRPDAAAAITELKQHGQRCWILSGDAEPRVQAVAQAVGVPQAQALGGLSPEGKLQFVQRLQAEGKIVAMIGDGLNDMPVLAAAHVSLAVGEGASLTSTVADGVLLASPPGAYLGAYQLARRTRRVMLGNLVWAVAYNVIAIPFAALGHITPLWASVGMASSSLLVVLHAATLLRGKSVQRNHQSARHEPGKS